MIAATLEIRFQGWFQVRLPTDPDTTDEPRGVSGYTFALPGEPDLDRVVRFQVEGHEDGPDVVLRPGSPLVTPDTFGVCVTDVALRGRAAPDHPLVGAKVWLPPGARFHMRNYVLTDGEAGTEAIDPFGLAFGDAREAPMLARDDVLYPPEPTASLWEVPVAWLKRRGGAFGPDPTIFQRVTGFDDPAAYRQARLVALRELRASTTDQVARAALDRRIEQLVVSGPADRRTTALTFAEHRQFALNGDVRVDHGVLGVDAIDTRADWPMELTQAVWDADLLCGWAAGSLSVPLRTGDGATDESA